MVRHIAPIVFFALVVGLAVYLEWRARRPTPPTSARCVESARILSPVSDGYECSPGAAVNIDVIRLAGAEFAAIQCRCPAVGFVGAL